MPTTTNKGYQVPTTGTETNTWGDLLNTGTFGVMDLNLGGIVTKNLTNVPVVLSATEGQNLICRLAGTLTGNVLVTTPCKGMTIVENATSGAFALTFGNGVGTPVTIPQGTRAVVITDATNGARTAADNQTEFAAGTRLPFAMASAPTGWVQDTTIDNATLRLVSGAGNGSGGTFNFTDVFTTRGFTGSVGGTALDITQIPLHGHPYRTMGSAGGSFAASGTGGIVLDDSGSRTNRTAFTGALSDSAAEQIGGSGGSQSHAHSLSINNAEFGVKYRNVIIAQKS